MSEPAVNSEVPPSLVFGASATNVKTFPATRPAPEAKDSGFTNFEDGIPADYQTTPPQQDPPLTPLKARLDDVNAIGRIASGFTHFRQCGGLVTYNREVATLIRGYPKGSVLEYWDGSNYRRVVSLMENNNYDFVSNPGYIDGIHWSFADVWEKPYGVFLDLAHQQTIEILPNGPDGLDWVDDNSIYNYFSWGGSFPTVLPLLSGMKKSDWIRIEHDSFVVLSSPNPSSANYHSFVWVGFRVKGTDGKIQTYTAQTETDTAIESVFPLSGTIYRSDLKPIRFMEYSVGSTCLYMRRGSMVQFVYSSENFPTPPTIKMTVVRLKR